MFKSYRWQSGCAALMSLTVTAGTVAPIFTAPSFAQNANTFTDVRSNYWASQFIGELANRGVIAGFPDGSFKPEQQVTRAQFAAMLRKAFQKAPKREGIRFADVPGDYWAKTAIQEAYVTGFLSGYPNNRFEPNQNIAREQVLVSLANGLEYAAKDDANNTLRFFNDNQNISGYARRPIAAATERNIVVNYPNVNFLKPGETATRAEVAAFIYQALLSSAQVSSKITSPYIVAYNNPDPVDVIKTVRVPQGTTIPIVYDKAKKILVTKTEKAPLTVTVSENIRTQNGKIVIPAGSQVVGELQPAKGGSQFIAKKLVLTNGTEYSINAQSQVITKTQKVQKGASAGTIIKDAVLGASAAAAVAAVTGDRAIATEEVLGGLAFGGLIGLFFGRESVDLIAIQPNTDLQMTINQEFQIALK
jgi:hypothetical protein